MKKYVGLLILIGLGAALRSPQEAYAQTLSLDQAVQGAVKDMERNLKAGTKVGVINFRSAAAELSDYVIEELSVALVNGKKLVVVDRKETDLIRQEMRLQLSGDVSDESAQSIGKMLGAQALVTGSLVNTGSSYRFRINVINVETVAREYATSLDINSQDALLLFLLNGGQGTPVAKPEPAKPAAAGAVQSAPVAYKVGDKGPAGGFVFYDKGNDTGGWRYLEAAPASAEFTAVWDPNNTGVPGTKTEIGEGKKNTWLMYDRFVTLAFRVTALNIGGYNDWFLPSKDELYLMYLNLSLRGLGSFKDDWEKGWYLSSSEADNDNSIVWDQSFNNGRQGDGNRANAQKHNTSYVRAVRAFSTAQATASVVPAPPPGQYKVGDRGPAGGLVFYDKGDSSDGWRYLEAAPASAEFTAQWDPNNTGVSNTQTGLGTGKENTRFMTDRLAVLSFRIAGLNIGGYSDWFLPSKDELHLMYLYLSLRGVGSFKDGYYWTSSGDGDSAGTQNFSNGGQSSSGKSNSYNVRAVRAFSTAQATAPVVPPPPPGQYKVGGAGPAGGIVFYDKGNDSDGWRYLEAAPASAEFTAVWDPNLTRVPGTKYEIGEGKKNTRLMSDRFVTLAFRVTGLNIGGYNDWFLPNASELHQMYLNLSLRGLGGFKDGGYWTSQEYSSDGDRAWFQRFSDGSQELGGSYSKREAYNVRAVRAFSTAQATAPVVPSPPPGQYKVGDRGPAGGLVFYDKGDSSDGWRYLEAAPASAEFTAQWDPNNTGVSNTQTGLGTGKENTRFMTDRLAVLSFRIAGLNIGGYSDWFLPSRDELCLMYMNLAMRGLGNFKDGGYWSSSQSDGGNAWFQRFSDGGQGGTGKSGSYNVRAARAF